MYKDKLNEIYEEMLNEKRSKAQLVDWNLAGYKKGDIINAVMNGINVTSRTKGLPEVTLDSVVSIINKLRFEVQTEDK